MSPTPQPCGALELYGSLTLSAGSYCFSRVRLHAGSALTVLGEVTLNLASGGFVMDAGSLVTGKGLGAAAGLGLGAGSGGGGAGHGGPGGLAAGAGAGAGTAYDSAEDPILMGSGGGSAGPSGAPGGEGGAALRVLAPQGNAVLNGSVDLSAAEGQAAPACCSQVGTGGGGGSGGSFQVRALGITGSGSLKAAGGRGGDGAMGGGGGAGGLISLSYRDSYSYFGSVDFAGGEGGSSWLWAAGGDPGGAGQVKVLSTAPAVMPSPTPLLERDGVVAFPQPASDRACFEVLSQGGGEVSIEVYNLALQPAARFSGSALPGAATRICESVLPLAPGVYLYRCKVKGSPGPLKKFWVQR